MQLAAEALAGVPEAAVLEAVWRLHHHRPISFNSSGWQHPAHVAVQCKCKWSVHNNLLSLGSCETMPLLFLRAA